MRLDHYNIRVPLERLEGLCRFYVEALGLTVGERPPFRTTGFWLYAEGHPLLHLVAFQGEAEAPLSTGWFNHMALKCRDFDGVVARLKAHGVAYEVEEVPLLRQRQIFFTDPAGVDIELNFDAAG
jgi:glyoxylase I family protein